MFKSTRGSELVSSPKAILNGLAPDGGLYVIDKLPTIDYHDFLNDDYQTMAAKILNKFFPEFEYNDLLKEIKEAYSSFDTKEVVKLHKCDNAFFLELYHGPTLAFKDLALVVLPRLMKLSKKSINDNKNLTILTATSGDTGGAALNGFKDIDGISIVVLYPNGGVSTVQEAQMSSFKSKNAKVIAVNGNFDDCQSLVKRFFNEHKDLNLSSANSINIARLAPQIVYYFYSYIYLVRTNQIKDGGKINFDVPTGNFGNIFAGFYAKKLGLPINDLICASNKNSVLTDFFNNGKYDKNRPFYKTNSPSMDILISSNLERLIYYGCNENSKLTNELMNQLSKNGYYDFNNPFNYFKSYSTNENDTLKLIRNTYDKYNYLIDPHTAVAYNAYLKYANEFKNNLKTVVVSTASPFKFPESVLESVGKRVEDGDLALKELETTFNVKKPSVLNYPKATKEIVDLNKAEDYIVDVIKCF